MKAVAEVQRAIRSAQMYAENIELSERGEMKISGACRLDRGKQNFGKFRIE